MPETRLVVKLKATAAVTNLVGARIRPMLLRNTDSLPAITYQRVGTIACNHSTGECDVAWASVQVNCWASSYAGAKALAAVVKAALSGWSDQTGSPKVDMCHWKNENDLGEGPEPGQDVQEYAVAQDFLIQYGT